MTVVKAYCLPLKKKFDITHDIKVVTYKSKSGVTQAVQGYNPKAKSKITGKLIKLSRFVNHQTKTGGVKCSRGSAYRKKADHCVKYAPGKHVKKTTKRKRRKSVR